MRRLFGGAWCLLRRGERRVRRRTFFWWWEVGMDLHTRDIKDCLQI